MKKYFIKLCVLACVLGLIFCACADNVSEEQTRESLPNLPAKQRSNDEIGQILKLGDNQRIYVMKGMLHGHSVERALVLIGSAMIGDTKQYIALFKDDYMATPNSYELTDVNMRVGIESGALVLEYGDNTNIFLKEDTSLPVSVVDSIQGAYTKTQDNLEWREEINKFYISPLNSINQNARDELNTALNGGAKSKAQLQEQLLKLARDDLEKLDAQSELVRIDEQDEMLYVDSKILTIGHFSYAYTGGAHGNSQYITQTFELESGESISSNPKDLFEPSEELFRVLTEALLAQYGDKIFIESLPIKKLPKYFFLTYLHDDLVPRVVLIWQQYEISPYSSGILKVELTLKDIKHFVRADSPYKYIFDTFAAQ